MTRYERNINQVNADFTAIKNKLIEAGADIPAGTPTAEYAEKVGELYDAGRQAEYDRFWDAKQPSKGAITTMNGEFGGHWTTDTFRPKYDIIPLSCPNLFFGNYLQIDLVEHLNNIGIKLDFSQCGNQNSAFYMSNFTHIGNASALGGYYNVFMDCKYLVTIDEWGDAQGREMTNGGLTSTFSGCTALENITIKGFFANDISFKDCTKLTKASIISIIDHLSSSASGKILTLSKTAVNTAFPDASNNTDWNALVTAHQNWTITLV